MGIARGKKTGEKRKETFLAHDHEESLEGEQPRMHDSTDTQAAHQIDLRKEPCPQEDERGKCTQESAVKAQDSIVVSALYNARRCHLL